MKQQFKKNLLIFMGTMFAVFLILNIVFVGYPLVMLRGAWMELTKHEFRAQTEMIEYLTAKYDEPFVMDSFNSPFMDANYYGVFHPLKNKDREFNVIGNATDNMEHPFRYKDNYIQYIWQDEIRAKLQPILTTFLPTDAYGVIHEYPENDYDVFDIPTLSLAEAQTQARDGFHIYLEIIYAIESNKEHDAVAKMNKLIQKINQTGFKNVHIKLHVFDVSIFNNYQAFQNIMKQYDMQTVIDEYSEYQINDMNIDLNEVHAIESMRQHL